VGNPKKIFFKLRICQCKKLFVYLQPDFAVFEAKFKQLSRSNLSKTYKKYATMSQKNISTIKKEGKNKHGF